VSASGLLDILSGGSAYGLTLSSGADAYLESGGVLSLATISNHGELEQLYGGVATSVTVDSGGGFYTFGASNDIATTINGGGSYHQDGGTATGTIANGGQYYIDNATASGALIENAGFEVISYGAQTYGTLVMSGGTETVSSHGNASGSIIGNGGFQVVSLGGTAEMTTIGSGGTQVYDPSATIISSIPQIGGSIDVSFLAYVSEGTATVDASDNLVVAEQGEVKIQLYGAYTNAVFATVSDGMSGTLVTLQSVPCYCLGTLIMTSQGETPVETLAIGDLVVTASGEHRPIKWIGCRSYAGRFLAANPNVQPIRFRAGSLGDGLPRRDLLVSPEHAMFLDDLLVPARCLANRSTIVQERGLDRVDYFHVELETHDVLLAEGAPSESFMDDDSRGMFHNAAEWETLYPNAPASGRFCAPKVDDGYELEVIRQRLSAVAQARLLAA
jgi:autotransporter passenger strand-loop-strand repeat protein